MVTRRLAFIVRQARIGAVLDEGISNDLIPMLRRGMKRRIAAALLRIWLGSGPEQHGDDLR